jgi:ABC-type multidrug transport system fused ATPase/permease subunit
MKSLKIKSKSLRFLLHLLFGAAVISLLAVVVMYLWNALIPVLFSLSALTFWQALGLLLLCRILFGGLNGHFSRMSHHTSSHPLREKWMKMSEHERREFINHKKAFHSSFSEKEISK